MTFQSDQLQCANSIYDLAGVRAYYLERDATRTCPVTVIVDYDLNQWGDVAEIYGKSAVITVRVSDVAEPPRQRDTFEIAETERVFIVDRVLLSDDVEHTVLVT